MDSSVAAGGRSGQQSGGETPTRPYRPVRVPGPRACGHNPRAPQLEPAWPLRRNRPAPIVEASAAARAYYHERDRTRPELLRRRRGRQNKKLKRKVRIETVTRKRSDRTEAQIRCLLFFFDRCSLSTLEVGRYEGGKVVAYYDLNQLAHATGLKRWRLDRAISDLVAAGYIYRHQPRDYDGSKQPGDQYRGEVALLKLSLKCFAAFGCSAERVKVHAERSEEKDHKARRKEERRAPVSPVGTLISSMIDPAVNDLRPALPKVRDADMRTYQIFTFEIAKANPGWDDDRIRHEAIRRLYPNGPPKR